MAQAAPTHRPTPIRPRAATPAAAASEVRHCGNSCRLDGMHGACRQRASAAPQPTALSSHALLRRHPQAQACAARVYGSPGPPQAPRLQQLLTWAALASSAGPGAAPPHAEQRQPRCLPRLRRPPRARPARPAHSGSGRKAGAVARPPAPAPSTHPPTANQPANNQSWGCISAIYLRAVPIAVPGRATDTSLKAGPHLVRREQLRKAGTGCGVLEHVRVRRLCPLRKRVCQQPSAMAF